MPDFEAQIGRVLVDERLSNEQQTTLTRLNRELKASVNSKAGTRLTYMFHLRNLALFVKKPFEAISKDDLIDFLGSLDGWKEGSKQVAKAKIKRFYKWLDLGTFKGHKYPARVEWIDTSTSNNQVLPFNPRDLISRMEVKRLIEAANNPQDKALISTLYESGGRANEITGMRLEETVVEERGVRIVLRGKSGERALLMIESAPYLTLWMNHHPLRDEGEGPLWVNFLDGKWRQVSYGKLHKMIRVLATRAGLKKHLYPHLFRHSAATYAAKFMTYAQMCAYFGWVPGSKAPKVYIHLSGKDLDETLLVMRGRETEKKLSVDLTLAPKKCVRCGTENPGDAKFCNLCGLILDEKEAHELLVKQTFFSEFDEFLKENPEKVKKFKAFLEEL